MTVRRSGFWAVAFAFLVVMAFATLPSPLYGLYRQRDGLSTITITIVYAIWAASTIAALIAVPFIAQRIGRRGVMLASVATMIAAAAVLVAWKALPGLLLGRLLTGVSVGLSRGTILIVAGSSSMASPRGASAGGACMDDSSTTAGVLRAAPEG